MAKVLEALLISLVSIQSLAASIARAHYTMQLQTGLGGEVKHIMVRYDTALIILVVVCIQVLLLTTAVTTSAVSRPPKV